MQGKIARTCCLILILLLVFAIGWWRHHNPHCDDDDHNNDDDTAPPPGPVPPLVCVTNPFGAAQNFSLFSLNSIVACNSGVQGRVASNGPITLQSYSVGLRITAGETPYNLISSNVIDWSFGTLWYGGMAGSGATLTDVDIIYESPNEIPAGGCCASGDCDLCSLEATEESPFDFPSATSQLEKLHTFWNSLAATEDAEAVVSGSSLEVTCPEGVDYSVVYVKDATELTKVDINCPNQTVLINYDESFTGFNEVVMTFGANTDSSKVIHHFNSETVSLEADQEGDVRGTFFAPATKFSFSGSVLTGNVIASTYADLGGGCNNGKINYEPFDGCIPVTDGQARANTHHARG